MRQSEKRSNVEGSTVATDERFGASAGLGSSLGSWVKKNRRLTGFLAILMVFPIAGVLFAYFTRSAPGKAGAANGSLTAISPDGSTGQPIAKPDPGKPLVPVTQAAPVFKAPPPPPSASMEYPQTSVTPLNPPAPTPGVQSALPIPTSGGSAPVSGTKAPFTPVSYPARHDKRFGDGCSGQLTLNSNELQFTCSDPRGNVQVAINEIGSVDENGVRLTSGKKYHFSIEGMSKNSEQAMFSDWLSRVR